MTNITIDAKKNAIEITKKFERAASKFGSDEYKALQEVRRDYPNFTIEVIGSKSSSSKNSYKGLTYDYMKKYIESHDDDEKSIMKEFLDLRGESEEAIEACAESLSYVDIREWFLGKFPAIKAFHEKRKKILMAS